MPKTRGEVNRIRALWRTRILAAALALFLAIFAASLPAAAAGSAVDALPEADQQCLGCHATEGMKKDLQDGGTLSLHVPGETYAKSVHKVNGCGSCHAEIDIKSHPPSKRDIKSLRQYSIERAEACRQCHEDAFKQYAGSVHAVRLSEGNPVAPVCTGCHGSHSVTPMTAYQTCVTCHSTALGAHQKWLPNAQLHHEVVSCAACHAPAALRMIDLRLYDPAAKQWVAEKEGEAQFEKLARSIDADGKGLDPEELRKLLAAINRDGMSRKTLRGRVELRTGVEAHRLAEKTQAVRSCESCHRAGAEPFQNVTVSITGSDGRPVRHRAQETVLSAPLAMAALPEFYAIGGTRSQLLDVLFVLALLGGAAVPIGHMAVRLFTRKLPKKGAGGSPPGNPKDRDK
jgi:hypothetical protein